MHHIFLGYFASEDFVLKNSHLSLADNKMQLAYINAIEKFDSNVQLITSVVSKRDADFYQSSMFIDINSKIAFQPGFLDFPILKKICLNFSIFNYLLKICKKKEVVNLIYYNTFLNYSILSWLISKFRTVNIYPIAISDPYYDKTFKSNVFRYLSRKFIAKSKGVISITEKLGKSLLQHVSPLVINGGIRTVNLEYLDRKNIRDTNDIRIVYTGSIYDRYNIKNLIESINYLEKNFSLHLYGRNVANYEIQDSLSERVFFYGEVSQHELYSIQTNASILVSLLSTDDYLVSFSFPSKIFEYLISYTPILSTKNEAFDTTLDEILYFVEDISPECIAKSIKIVANESELIRRTRIIKTNEYLMRNTWDEHSKRIFNYLKKGIE